MIKQGPLAPAPLEPRFRGRLKRDCKIADPEACDQMYESLVRIHTNYYKNKYPRLKDTSFTGVTVEDCKMILATDVLKQMEDMKKGTWRKLRERFYAKKPDEDVK
ncbi:hypothetical protein AV530_019021 [Patagioenas fasciata monilis]|uniref:Mitochondrial nucleoid factor 1 n=1 Tax=Patagioenas fasciata monilis TaxID=372326 RepID=A0A1V4KY07_PATFA|nr:hypothetical protein AV530_019021 [Patagioenas fasciata monilis]